MSTLSLFRATTLPGGWKAENGYSSLTSMQNIQEYMNSPGREAGRIPSGMNKILSPLYIIVPVGYLDEGNLSLIT